jgi:hypothetical protein
MTFRGALFVADFAEAQVFTGWTDGSEWNGWASPVFELSEGNRIVDLHRNRYGEDSAYFDSELDAFVFWFDGAGNREIYAGITVETSMGPSKVYPIGKGVWIWEEMVQAD